MNEILHIETIHQYNTLVGQETLHPLVSVIDYSKVPEMIFPAGHSFGFYAIFLKEVMCGDIKYGRNYYDYQEGTLVFIAPGQVINIENRKKHKPKGMALLFHPDLLRGTSLGRSIRDYNFFSYAVSEALHLSEQERQNVLDCLSKIEIELCHAIDKHSKTLIVSNVELLLNYSVRFYDRQFITRSNPNSDILVRFERLLGDYFDSDKPQNIGLPSVKFCADELHLSANYLGDLIKKETGKTASEHIQLKLIDIAKERVFDTSRSVSEIAYGLGFQYPQHFSRLFKKCVGVSPNEYRTHTVQYEDSKEQKIPGN